MIRAVIFDLDGTISDSESIHQQAERETLKQYGVAVSRAELEDYTGTTTEFFFGKLIKKYNISASVTELFKIKEDILFSLSEKALKPIKGAIEFVKGFQALKLKLAIASSGHHRFINFVLEKFEIKNLFQVIIGSEDIEKSKPDPEIFLKAAAGLKEPPEHCLVIEDSRNGVMAARAAGMSCLGYQNSPSQDLSAANLVISDFTQVNALNLIEKLN